MLVLYADEQQACLWVLKEGVNTAEEQSVIAGWEAAVAVCVLRPVDMFKSAAGFERDLLKVQSVNRKMDGGMTH